MIHLEDVTKLYGNGPLPVIALDHLSLRIERGEFVAVAGPSGSGKTTLLLTVAGLITPTSGRVVLDGEPVYDLPMAQRAALRLRTVGFLFQTFNLMPYLTALENVQVPLCLARVDGMEQVERAEALLERVGLAHRLHHRPAELSVGERQRVALARCLANRPAIILADEPTGNLDPTMGGEIIRYFELLNADGVTIVMVTHDPEAAARAQRQVHIDAGALASN